MNDVTYLQGCVTANSKRNFNFAIDVYCLNSIAHIQKPRKRSECKRQVGRNEMGQTLNKIQHYDQRVKKDIISRTVNDNKVK